MAPDPGSNRHGTEPDPQRLLPEPLRLTWIVLPRGMGYWLFTVGSLLGFGLGLSVAGAAFGSGWLVSSFAVTLLLGMAGMRILRGYEDRSLRELGPHLPR